MTPRAIAIVVALLLIRAVSSSVDWIFKIKGFDDAAVFLTRTLVGLVALCIMAATMLVVIIATSNLGPARGPARAAALGFAVFAGSGLGILARLACGDWFVSPSWQHIRDFVVAASSPVSLDGSYAVQSALQLTSAGVSGTRSFAATYVPGSETSPSIAAVAGHYSGVSGHVSGRRSATWNIDSAGNISGTNDAGCIFNGTITPRADAHAFDWTLDGNVNCIFAGNHLTGILYYDEATGQMRAFAPYLQRMENYFIIGTRN